MKRSMVFKDIKKTTARYIYNTNVSINVSVPSWNDVKNEWA